MDPKHSLGPDRIDYRETPEDLSEVHAAILRENPEPSAAVTPIPLWLISICGVAVAWAGAYLGMFNGGFRGDIFNERISNPDLLFGVPGRNGAGSAAPAPELSLADQGKKVYGDYCVTCHQPTGMGAPGQYPPLAKSEYVNGGDKRMIAIILKGIQGSFSVEGAQYNNQMPTWELTLSDKKIAAVATFVRSSFGNSAPEVTPAKVAAAKKEFAGQTTPWTADGIAKIPADAMLPDEGGSATPAKGAPASGGAAPAPAPAAP
jgi:mono/diheme cytochrome c family protein